MTLVFSLTIESIFSPDTAGVELEESRDPLLLVPLTQVLKFTSYLLYLTVLLVGLFHQTNPPRCLIYTLNIIVGTESNLPRLSLLDLASDATGYKSLWQ
jgi:hypothetical protein